MATYLTGVLVTNVMRSIDMECMALVRLDQSLHSVQTSAMDNSASSSGRPNQAAQSPFNLVSGTQRLVAEMSVTASELKSKTSNIMAGLRLYREIIVYNTVIRPYEFMLDAAEKQFNAAIVQLMSFNQTAMSISPPSTLLAAIGAYGAGLLTLEDTALCDTADIFTKALLDHSQLKHPNVEWSIAAAYGSVYMALLARQAQVPGGYLFSSYRFTFVTNETGAEVPMIAENYTDRRELQALCQLIGPYGVRTIDQLLLRVVTEQVAALKQLVTSNNDALQNLMYVWSDRIKSSEFSQRLRNPDELLARTIYIGVILSFRRLLFAALSDVMERRVPFISNCIKNLYMHFQLGENAEVGTRVAGACPCARLTPGAPPLIQAIDRLATAAGIHSIVDPQLCDALRPFCTSPQHDFRLWNLLLIFYAFSLPSLASAKDMGYRPALDANSNNAHCLAIAMQMLSAALISLSATEDNQVANSQLEFLRVRGPALRAWLHARHTAQ